MPALHRHRVGLALLAVGIVTAVNLGGIRESGRTFAGPTYLFIGSLFLMLLVGFGRFLVGGLPPGQAAEAPAPIADLTLFLLLRAFSSGCTALTGVEAISNGVPAFRPPESKNAVGVFLSFTLSQAGMVRHWLVERGPHWRKSLLVNGLGAVATGLATGVLAVTKFTHGAWLVALVIPVLDYARSFGSDIRAVSVDLEPEETTQMKAQWEVWGGVPLVILPSPYRSFLGPCLAYIEEVREKDPDRWVTVILPEGIPARWWQNLLHNQRALIIRAALLFTSGVMVTAVPYHLER